MYDHLSNGRFIIELDQAMWFVVDFELFGVLDKDKDGDDGRIFENDIRAQGEQNTTL